jgi:hypothetical protein
MRLQNNNSKNQKKTVKALIDEERTEQEGQFNVSECRSIGYKYLIQIKGMVPNDVVEYMYTHKMFNRAFTMCDYNDTGLLDKKLIPMFLQDLGN